MKWGKRTTHAMVNMFVVRASARISGTRYGLKAALQTPHFIRLKCYIERKPALRVSFNGSVPRPLEKAGGI